MAIGLDSIWNTLQNGVTAINNLASNVKTVFPQISGNSTVTPSSAGALSFSSSQPVGFTLVTLSSGATVKFPYYNQ